VGTCPDWSSPARTRPGGGGGGGGYNLLAGGYVTAVDTDDGRSRAIDHRCRPAESCRGHPGAAPWRVRVQPSRVVDTRLRPRCCPWRVSVRPCRGHSGAAPWRVSVRPCRGHPGAAPWRVIVRPSRVVGCCPLASQSPAESCYGVLPSGESVSGRVVSALTMRPVSHARDPGQCPVYQTTHAPN